MTFCWLWLIQPAIQMRKPCPGWFTPATSSDSRCPLAEVSAAVGQEPWKQPDSRKLHVETRIFGEYGWCNLRLTERRTLFRVPIGSRPVDSNLLYFNSPISVLLQRLVCGQIQIQGPLERGFALLAIFEVILSHAQIIINSGVWFFGGRFPAIDLPGTRNNPLGETCTMMHRVLATSGSSERLCGLDRKVRMP